MKLKLIYIILIQFVIINTFVITVFAQPTLEWFHRYPDKNNSNPTVAHTLTLDDSGNVYVAGIQSNSFSIMGFCTIKYNSTGTQQWVANYYGSNSGGRQPYAIAVDKNSNVIVTGYDYSFSSYFDFCTIKYNSSGIQQWIKFYDGPGHGIDQAEVMAIDNANNIYVAGFSTLGGSHFVCTTIKYSTDGRELWVHNNGIGGNGAYVNGIVVDDNCNVYITGQNNNFTDTMNNAVTIKYDSSGNQLWLQTYYRYDIGGGASANSITLDQNYNVYVTGFSLAEAPRYLDLFTIKYSESGIQQWLRRYNDDTATYSRWVAQSIAVDNFRNIYVSGFREPDQGTPRYFYTVKYTNNGDLIWVRKDTGRLAYENTFMDIDKNCNVYLESSHSINNRISTFTTIKFDSSGIQQWFLETEDTLARSSFIKTDKNFNIYITGSRGGKRYRKNVYL